MFSFPLLPLFTFSLVRFFHCAGHVSLYMKIHHTWPLAPLCWVHTLALSQSQPISIWHFFLNNQSECSESPQWIILSAYLIWHRVLFYIRWTFWHNPTFYLGLGLTLRVVAGLDLCLGIKPGPWQQKCGILPLDQQKVFCIFMITKTLLFFYSAIQSLI